MIRSEIYTNDSFLYTNLAHKLVAATINAAVSPTNAIESHYKTYFDLYLAFAINNFEASTAANKDALIELASLCPGKDGACVYQARALYHTAFKEPFDFPETCFESSGRMARSMDRNVIDSEKWRIEIYPNPNNGRLNISSNVASEQLEIKIYDLSGRTLLTENLKLEGLATSLYLTLNNGAYLISVTNKNNEKFIKKLLVNR
jgi:hypothetical protein